VSLSPFPIFDSVVSEQNFDPRTLDPETTRDDRGEKHIKWLTALTNKQRKMTPEEVVGRINALRKEGIKVVSNGRTRQVGGRTKAVPRAPKPRAQQPST
jgi:hypothetical protein